MNELPHTQIKNIMNDWVLEKIRECKANGVRISRTAMADRLNVTPSCFSQYLNPHHPKNAPWEFQVKLAEMLNKSIRQLHPELIDLNFAIPA